MMNTNKLFDLAYEKYPESPGGYFDGEMMDGNSYDQIGRASCRVSV